MPHIVTVIGNVTQDIKSFSDGKVIRFGIASSEGKDNTKFFNCVAFEGDFREKAFTLLKGQKKGGSLMLVGKLQDSTYKDKEGVEKKATDFVIRDFSFVGGKRKTEEAGATADKGGKSDDVPF